MSHQDQAARCVLKLNTPVLNALFPEGSEARVDLVAAALHEAARKHIGTGLTVEIKAHLDNLAKEIKAELNLDAIINSYFTGGGWSKPITLTPDTKLTVAIATAIEKAFTEKFYATMEEQIERRVKEYTDNLESRVEYAVKQRVEQLTAKAIQTRVDAAVAAAREAL